MRRYSTFYCFLSFFLALQFSYGQSFVPPKIYSVKTENGLDILCDNPNAVEVSVQIDFKSTNLAPKEQGQVFIVPANKKAELLNSFTKINNDKGYSFGIKSRSIFGNVTSIHDKNYTYQLPFSSQIPIKVSQGYNGKFSHSGVKALDFNLSIGFPVLAAREGIVVFIQDKFEVACPEPRCAKFNNYVTIQHTDGSFAEYGHITKGSAKVKVGDKVVLARQEIAKVGNTGYSSGPHLHFEVYTQDFSGKKYQDTYFSTSENKKTLIQEGSTYLPSF